MFDTIIAKVEKKLPVQVRKTKDGSDFKTQKVVVVFNEQDEYPSKMVLEQWGDKKIELANSLVEWKTYEFSLNRRANYWTWNDWVETAFSSVSAWRADEQQSSSANTEDVLPF